MISNDTPYTPTLKTIKQSKLNCKKKPNIAAVLITTYYRTPQLNNRAEKQTVKKPNISAVSSMHNTSEEIVNYMRCFYYPVFGKKSVLCLCFQKVNRGEGMLYWLWKNVKFYLLSFILIGNMWNEILYNILLIFPLTDRLYLSWTFYKTREN